MDAVEPNRALEAAWQLLSSHQRLSPGETTLESRQGQAMKERLPNSTSFSTPPSRGCASPRSSPSRSCPGSRPQLRRATRRRPISRRSRRRHQMGRAAGRHQARRSPTALSAGRHQGLSQGDRRGEREEGRGRGHCRGRNLITIDDFAKIELKVGLIKTAERIPKSKKLMKLMVDLGESEPRQLVAGIAEAL